MWDQTVTVSLSVGCLFIRSMASPGHDRVSSCAPFVAAQGSVAGGQFEPGIAMASATIDCYIEGGHPPRSVRR